MAVSALATAAAGAYINAKLKLSNDLVFVSSISRSQKQFDKRFADGTANLFYTLEEHARNPKIANEQFLIFEDKRWTFKETYTQVLKYAGFLAGKHNVVAGEIIALDFMNSDVFCFLVLAVWSLGATPALINYNLIGKPLIHSVRISTARLLIVDPEVAVKALTEESKREFLAPNFRNDAFPLEIQVLDEGLQKSMPYWPPYRAPDASRKIIRPNMMANLIYTSGTTGMPKAAIVPWSRQGIGGVLCANILGLRPVTDKKPDRFYTCMPLYHTTAFTLGFNPCLQSATTFVIGRKFSVSNFWSEVKASDVTVIQYVGETLRYLMASPPSPQDQEHHVRMAFGNGLRPDVWKTFKARFAVPTIVEVYGMTEGVGAVFNINRNDFSDGAIGSYGSIVKLMTRKTQAIIKVDYETEQPWRNPATHFCERVPLGSTGELVYALDPAAVNERFVGYLNNEAASNSKLLRNVFQKGDVYFRTGDTVRLDNDGRLWFADRIGDTYRWKSENVSTAEVSEALGHHRAVQEANVYGVTVPGHEGRAGCAAILMKPDALQDGQGSVTIKPEVLESLATHVANSLPKYAVPIFLRVVRELTLTGNNKQQKTGLRNEGIDLKTIGKDRIYWLKPKAGRYVEFTAVDLVALDRGSVRL